MKNYNKSLASKIKKLQTKAEVFYFLALAGWLVAGVVFICSLVAYMYQL